MKAYSRNISKLPQFEVLGATAGKIPRRTASAFPELCRTSRHPKSVRISFN